LLLAKACDDRDPVRVVLVDLDARGLDGFALAHTVRADARLRDVSLIAMHRIGRTGLEARMQEAGFAADLAKPVRRAELARALERALAAGTPAASPLLPVAPVGGAAAHAGVATPTAAAPGPRRHLRVLLAEDNPVNQRVAVGMLRKLGIEPEVVGNGAEAIAALARDAFDLVFMDVQMPEIDGLEATRVIRRPGFSGPNRDVPVIALTAHAMLGDRDRCLQAGMTDYIAKPVSLQAVAAVVQRWCPAPLVPGPPG
jgi:CheY-like chemotaxis protein